MDLKLGVSPEIIETYFDVTEEQRVAFKAMRPLYEQWNSQINVISRKDIDNFYQRHVLHSLAIAKLSKISNGQSVLDLGCGGGFPVVPLAVMLPEVNFLAVDSIGKKIRVVRAVVEELELKNVAVENCRVEAINQRFDWVVSRAVAPLKELMEWTYGKWTKGMLLLKGGDLHSEILEAGFKLNENGSYSKGRDLELSIIPITDIFEGEYFVTKAVVVVEKKN